MVKSINGQRFRVWELTPGRANEALDLAVYSYGALCGLLHFGLKLNLRADEVAIAWARPAPAQSEVAPTLVVAQSVLDAKPLPIAPPAAPAPPERRSLLGRYAAR